MIAALYIAGFSIAGFGFWLSRIRASSLVRADSAPVGSFSSPDTAGAAALASFPKFPARASAIC